jgi:hypothetical protein
VYPLEDRGLAHLDEVWRDSWGDNDYGVETADPGTVTDRAMAAWQHREELSMDRMVVHYMQPHMPFRSQPEWFNGWGDVWDFGDVENQDDVDIWLKLRDGQFGPDVFWRAYADNLEWVLEEVRRWADESEATILITSDHGNAKGEWGQWSHPPGSSNPVLRRVPWCIVEGGGDGVSSEASMGSDADVNVEERLRDMGYI